MLRTKNMPLHTLNTRMAAATERLSTASFKMLLSTRVRLVTRRIATMSPEVKGRRTVTAITFSPMAVWYTARPMPSSLA